VTKNRLLNYYCENCIEAGCDEAGRGCLAGDVFAAAVILPNDFACEDLNDSKQMTELQRERVKPFILANALAWAVARASAAEIDKINILNASILAMHRAIEQLNIVPEHLIVDGNRFKPFRQIPHKTVVKGDAKYLSIAAASVLAKTFRDEYMIRLHSEYPLYGWDNNKGYPTKMHREAIKQFGVTQYHRKSFLLVDLKLF
jgi:ribonuclease HII